MFFHNAVSLSEGPWEAEEANNSVLDLGEREMTAAVRSPTATVLPCSREKFHYFFIAAAITTKECFTSS